MTDVERYADVKAVELGAATWLYGDQMATDEGSTHNRRLPMPGSMQMRR